MQWKHAIVMVPEFGLVFLVFFCHLQMCNVAEPSTNQQCEILPILLNGLNPHASDDFPESV